MTTDRAEEIGARALAWLAADPELLGVFMGASGLSPDDLRSTAGGADLPGAVLDFLLMDDAWVVGFCDAEGLAYEVPMQARMALPGGAQTHWT